MKLYVHVDRYGDVKILVEDIDTNVVDPKALVESIRETAKNMRKDLKDEEHSERHLRGW